MKKIWTEEMIIHHILHRYNKEPVNYHYYVTHYPDVHAAGCRIFGTWKNAIEACGLDYSKIRKYRTWSARAVIEEIQYLNEQGKPLNSHYNQIHRKALYMAAVKRFKSWGNALAKAGINYKKVRLRRLMTPEEIKREIKRLIKRGENLSYTNMRKKHQYLLAAAMKKLGNGSWAEARRKCGVDISFRNPAERKKYLLNLEKHRQRKKNAYTTSK